MCLEDRDPPGDHERERSDQGRNTEFWALYIGSL